MTISVNIRINQYFRETASCQGQQTANSCLTDTRVRKMFGVLRKSVLGTQSVKNAVNKQTLRNFGEDVQVGRPLNRWGPHAMWVSNSNFLSAVKTAFMMLHCHSFCGK